MKKKHATSDILHTKPCIIDPYGSISMPVYNSVAFEFDCAEAMEAAFSGKTTDHTYSRISNPTVEHFENRVKAITQAKHVTALSSGMAAISNIVFTLAKSGLNLVTSKHLFGNTYSFFQSTLAAFGVEVRFCDLLNLEEVKKKIDGKTCGLFLEIITNPQMEVADLKSLSEICKSKKIPLIADSTIVPFTSFKASDFGVDIETVSSTKYISGGATSIGGLIIDYGTFDWRTSERLRELERLHGRDAFNFKLRKEIHRNLGAYMSPQTAYMQSLGLETLEVRFLRAAETTKKLVEELSNHPKVEKVNYTDLKENRFYEISRSQFGEFPGAMFTIDLQSKEACFQFINKLQVIRRATNLFDNQSLAIHPASTIYVNFSQKERDEMNISDKTIRFSIGLEEFEVLIEDFERALG
ncbi:MAG: O-acetylhomoserine aminocarboxypropyltransferase/cysteine synthase [Porphyromonadaceae bacterium]|nr:O-acetylhomoserine aminocarboxypropyltransferase/cysteine synthase [Porphyromonadaceae bacterium]